MMGGNLREYKRTAERRPCNDMLQGELFHGNSSQAFYVESVRDLSLHGIGLNTDGLFDPGEQIRLVLTQGCGSVELCGFVAWCSTSGKGSDLFALGIKLQ